jgi:hypothetical protein
VRADELNERHMGRWVKVGDVVGELAALLPAGDVIHVVAIVGGRRAIFPLTPDAHVEHWRKEAT